MTNDFSFKIDEKVKIKQNDAEGTVIGLWVDEWSNKKVNVRYCDRNGLIAYIWLREEDIEKADV